ncbi:MAG TPA: hypothetical protein VFR67_27995 [Pilimelia sp.]|nr:hypothetical protein [Pilimelia sp.]
MTQPETTPDRELGTGVPGSDLIPTAGKQVGEAVAGLAAGDIEPAERRKLLGRLASAVDVRRMGGLFRPKAALRWVVDAVTDVAPHVPVRDLATLRRHFDGLDDEELADRLVRNAARATAGVGAVGGGIVAVEWIATPTLLTAPVMLAVETVAVVAIELKLIGELHEVYRQPVPGNTAERAAVLLRSWSEQRGVNPMLPGVGAAILGTAARKELRDRLLRRFGRNLTTLGPLLTGAAVAGYLNRRATLIVSQRVREDLRKRRDERPALPATPSDT